MVGSSSESFIDRLNSLEFNKPLQRSIFSKIINITIRWPYFIFCRRNKPWTDPKLLAFRNCAFMFIFSFLLFFLFLLYCVEICWPDKVRRIIVISYNLILY